MTIIQIIRIQTITNLTNYLDSAHSIMWSIMEANIGIIITCIPPLAPLVKYFSEKSRSGTGSGSKQPEPPYALRTWGTGSRALRGGHEEDIIGVTHGGSMERMLTTDAGVTHMDAAVVAKHHKIREGDTQMSDDRIEEERFEGSQKPVTPVGV